MAPLFRGLHRLAVDDPNRRLFLSALTFSLFPTKGLAYSLPGPVVAPVPEVVLDRRPGREIVGHHPPLATRAQDVEDAVHDLPKIVLPRMAGPLLMQQRPKDFLFLVGKTLG